MTTGTAVPQQIGLQSVQQQQQQQQQQRTTLFLQLFCWPLRHSN
jgi:hypothetical protein